MISMSSYLPKFEICIERGFLLYLKNILGKDSFPLFSAPLPYFDMKVICFLWKRLGGGLVEEEQCSSRKYQMAFPSYLRILTFEWVRPAQRQKA